MSLQTITEREMKSASISILPVHPNRQRALGGRELTPAEAKEAFDRLPRLVAERYNELVEEIRDGSYLASVPYGENTTLRDHLDELTVRLGGAEETLDTLEGALEEESTSHSATLAEHGSALAEQGAAVTSLTARTAELDRSLAFVQALLFGSTIAYAEVTDTFSARRTAGSLHIVDDTETVVTRVAGNTTIREGLLCHSSFSGILSTGKSLVDLSVYDGTVAENGKITISAHNNTLTVSAEDGQEVRNRPIIVIDASILQDGETYIFYQDTVFGESGYAYQEKNALFWSVNTISKETGAVKNKTTVGGDGCYSITVDRAKYDYTIRIQTGSYQYNGAPLNSTVSFMLLRDTPDEARNGYEEYKEDRVFVMTDAEGNPCNVTLGAYDYIDVTRQKLVRQTATVAFDGSESWGMIFSDDGPYIVLADDAFAGVTAGMCNWYIHDSAEMPTEEGTFSFTSSPYGIAIRDSGSSNSIEAWTTSLSDCSADGHPLMIAYRSPTAVEEDISLPTGYTVWRGGSERVLPLAASGVPCTVSQSYYVTICEGVTI